VTFDDDEIDDENSFYSAAARWHKDPFDDAEHFSSFSSGCLETPTRRSPSVKSPLHQAADDIEGFAQDRAPSAEAYRSQAI